MVLQTNELENEESSKFPFKQSIGYLDEIGLTPSDKYKAEISDILQEMIGKKIT